MNQNSIEEIEAYNNSLQYRILPDEIWCRILKLLPLHNILVVQYIDHYFYRIYHGNAFHIWPKSGVMEIKENIFSLGSEKVSLAKASTENKIQLFNEIFRFGVYPRLSSITLSNLGELFLCQLVELLREWHLQDPQRISPSKLSFDSIPFGQISSIVTIFGRVVTNLSIVNRNDVYTLEKNAFIELFLRLNHLESVAIQDYSSPWCFGEKFYNSFRGKNLRKFAMSDSVTRNFPLVLNNCSANGSLDTLYLKNSWIDIELASLRNLRVLSHTYSFIHQLRSTITKKWKLFRLFPNLEKLILVMGPSSPIRRRIPAEKFLIDFLTKFSEDSVRKLSIVFKLVFQDLDEKGRILGELAKWGVENDQRVEQIDEDFIRMRVGRMRKLIEIHIGGKEFEAFKNELENGFD